MLESEFHHRADETLDRIEEALEAAEPQGLESDRMDGTLTITLPSGRQLVVNKHTPSQEMWLASPVSGGLHFSWVNGEGWMLKDGRYLGTVLSDDLLKLMSVKIAMPDLVMD